MKVLPPSSSAKLHPSLNAILSSLTTLVVDLKQNERWTDWMKKGKKICIAWGNGKWSYSVGLKLTASMSSSRQLQSRIQQHIQQMEHVKKLTRKKNLEIENIVKYNDNPKLKKEYEENLCILRSQIKFLEISEMYCILPRCALTANIRP
jgi:hypothetical protein